MAGVSGLSAATDTKALLRRLDEAIDSSDVFVARREARIAALRHRLAQQHSPDGRYPTLRALYDEYSSYKNDSAMACLWKCIETANALGRKADAADCMSLLVYQCSETGLYTQARDLLRDIDTTQLDATGRIHYAIACQHLYNELAYYSRIPALQKRYSAEAGRRWQEVQRVVPHDNYHYIVGKMMGLYFQGRFDAALAVSDSWIKNTKPGSHDFAIAAYYRYLVCRKRGDMPEAMRLVIESAISDVRNAVMDQASMWELASILNDNPSECNRAVKYISFAWKAAQTFNTRLRNNQISPVLTAIESSNRESLNKINTTLTVITIVIALLLASVLALLLYANRQRRRLALAHSRLEQANASLNESNRVKEVYLGRFMGLCSTYIEKTETLKRNIARQLKAKDYDRLSRLVENNPADRDDFYRDFDTAFLKLFPHFIDDFNALLRPEARIALTPDGQLPTPARIFALIRLGIDDSSRISEFLDYSVNTIYNYRAKIKKGALGDRDDFERQVRNIGMGV